MNKEALIGKLLAATPAELNRVAAVFAGETPTEPTDRRLLTIAQTARALNLSRTTVWRMLRDGALPCVEIRPGSRRVPSEAITALVKGGLK
jgi:excisionase family DNA binding protein